MLNLTLLACVNAKETHRAAELLELVHETEDSHSRIADVVSYNTVTKGLAQEGRAAECLQYMHRMRKHNIKPDEVTLGYFVDVCAKDDTDFIAHTIRELGAAGRGTEVETYGLFLRGLVRGGHVAKAAELFTSIQSSGIVLDLASYAMLVKAAVDAHDLDRALIIVQSLRDAGLEINDVILTHLVEGCRHAGDHDLGRKLFEEALAAGIQPSEYTLITMLKLLGRCGAHNEAQDLVKRWHQDYGCKPSVIHFTCLMSGCLRSRNYDQAWAAFVLMQRSGVDLDRMALSTLMHGMVAAQHWERVLELAEAAAKLRLQLPAEAIATAISQLKVNGSSATAQRLCQLSRQ
jgi:pentatricopeptide repeat protein